MRRFNIYLTGVPEREDRQSERETVFKSWYLRIVQNLLQMTVHWVKKPNEPQAEWRKSSHGGGKS